MQKPVWRAELERQREAANKPEQAITADTEMREEEDKSSMIGKRD